MKDTVQSVWKLIPLLAFSVSFFCLTESTSNVWMPLVRKLGSQALVRIVLSVASTCDGSVLLSLGCVRRGVQRTTELSVACSRCALGFRRFICGPWLRSWAAHGLTALVILGWRLERERGFLRLLGVECNIGPEQCHVNPSR